MHIDFFLHKNYEKPNTRLTDKSYRVNFWIDDVAI